MSDRFWGDGKIVFSRLEEAGKGGFWNVHCDTLAALVDAVAAANKMESAARDGSASDEELMFHHTALVGSFQRFEFE